MVVGGAKDKEKHKKGKKEKGKENKNQKKCSF
jgi:hypothetical protein